MIPGSTPDDEVPGDKNVNVVFDEISEDKNRNLVYDEVFRLLGDGKSTLDDNAASPEDKYDTLDDAEETHANRKICNPNGKVYDEVFRDENVILHRNELLEDEKNTLDYNEASPEDKNDTLDDAEETHANRKVSNPNAKEYEKKHKKAISSHPNGDTIECCRKFLGRGCNFADCKFAHPPQYVKIESNSCVRICKDYLSGRCNRDHLPTPCRYFHLPTHLLPKYSKFRRFSESGRSLELPHWNGCSSFDGSHRMMSDRMAFYEPRRLMDDRRPRRDSRIRQSHDRRPKRDSRDSIEVCREFKRGACMRKDCQYAHPPGHLRPSADGTVTICFDFINNRCNREKLREPCRYYHPEPHQIKEIQNQRRFGSVRKRKHELPRMMDDGRPFNMSPRLMSDRTLFDRPSRMMDDRMPPRMMDDRRPFNMSPQMMSDRTLFDRPSRMMDDHVSKRAKIHRINQDSRFRRSRNSIDRNAIPYNARDNFRSRGGADIYDRSRYHEIHDIERINSPMRNQPIVERRKLADIPKQIEVCQNYEREKTCKVSDCKYAHTPKWVRIKDGMVTICRDYLRGVCNREHLREPCRYFHVPSHIIQQKLSRKRRFPDDIPSHV